MLNELGLFEVAVEPGAWHALTTWAAMNETFEESRTNQLGRRPVMSLRHEVHLPNEQAAATFQATVPLRSLSLEVQNVEQLAETLPDRRVTLVGRCECRAAEMTRRTSALILAASHVQGRYEGFQEVWDLSLGDEPGVIRTNLMNCFAGSLDTQSTLPRDLKARSECIRDTLLAHTVLAPWALAWKDTDSLRLRPGSQVARTSGLDRDIEVVVSHDAPPVDQLVWMLNQVPDLHVVAETLTGAERYTGRRLPGGLIDRMAPPPNERQAMADRLASLCDALQDMVRDARAARDAVIRTLPSERPTPKRSVKRARSL